MYKAKPYFLATLFVITSYICSFFFDYTVQQTLTTQIVSGMFCGLISLFLWKSLLDHFFPSPPPPPSEFKQKQIDSWEKTIGRSTEGATAPIPAGTRRVMNDDGTFSLIWIGLILSDTLHSTHTTSTLESTQDPTSIHNSIGTSIDSTTCSSSSFDSTGGGCDGGGF